MMYLISSRFIKFHSEEDARIALDAIKKEKIDGIEIQAGLKSSTKSKQVIKDSAPGFAEFYGHSYGAYSPYFNEGAISPYLPILSPNSPFSVVNSPNFGLMMPSFPFPPQVQSIHHIYPTKNRHDGANDRNRNHKGNYSNVGTQASDFQHKNHRPGTFSSKPFQNYYNKSPRGYPKSYFGSDNTMNPRQFNTQHKSNSYHHSYQDRATLNNDISSRLPNSTSINTVNGVLPDPELETRPQLNLDTQLSEKLNCMEGTSIPDTDPRNSIQYLENNSYLPSQYQLLHPHSHSKSQPPNANLHASTKDKKAPRVENNGQAIIEPSFAGEGGKFKKKNENKYLHSESQNRAKNSYQSKSGNKVQRKPKMKPPSPKPSPNFNMESDFPTLSGMPPVENQNQHENSNQSPIQAYSHIVKLHQLKKKDQISISHSMASSAAAQPQQENLLVTKSQNSAHNSHELINDIPVEKESYISQVKFSDSVSLDNSLGPIQFGSILTSIYDDTQGNKFKFG